MLQHINVTTNVFGWIGVISC